MGGTRAPQDLSVENYARLTAELAERLGCAAVVGHSMGANVALEMAGSGAFIGPVVLLAPSFFPAGRGDGHPGPGSARRVLGRLPFRMLRFMMRFAVRGSPLPPDRLAVLLAELQKNDPEFMRRGIHRYLQYLDRHGSVAARLCAAAGAGLGRPRPDRRRRDHRRGASHAAGLSVDPARHDSRWQLLHP